MHINEFVLWRIEDKQITVMKYTIFLLLIVERNK
jgi:hypothetical protein